MSFLFHDLTSVFFHLKFRDVMEDFDDNLPKRRFDNFQFVPFYETMAKAENRDITFSVKALMEIPDQYKAIKQLGLL